MKSGKYRIMLLLAGAFSLCFAGAAQAGIWRQGAGADESRWWYDNGDGTYPAGQWAWIDGNEDGTAECYYFDGTGWMLSAAQAPDGRQVDEKGQWVENGQVRQKRVTTPYQRRAFTAAAEAMVRVYADELSKTECVAIQPRYILYEDRCAILENSLNAEAARLLANPQEQQIYPAVLQDDSHVYFDSDKTQTMYWDLYGIGINPNGIPHTAAGQLIGTPDASGTGVRAEIGTEEFGGSFLYLALPYETFDTHTGEVIRHATLYMTLVQKDGSAFGYQISHISNETSRG